MKIIKSIALSVIAAACAMSLSAAGARAEEPHSAFPQCDKLDRAYSRAFDQRMKYQAELQGTSLALAEKRRDLEYRINRYTDQMNEFFAQHQDCIKRAQARLDQKARETERQIGEQIGPEMLGVGVEILQGQISRGQRSRGSVPRTPPTTTGQGCPSGQCR